MHIKLAFWSRAIHLFLPVTSILHARAQFGVGGPVRVWVGVWGLKVKAKQPTELNFNFGFGD